MSIRNVLSAAAVAAACFIVAAPLGRAAVTPVAHVETRGKGPVHVVLVPGFACDWTVWNSFMERNAERYTMHAVTLPGFAGTDAPPAGGEGPTPLLDNAVAALAQVIGENGLQRPIVVGHSIGGLLAIRLACEKPELVAGVVSVDGMPTYPLGAPIPPEQRPDVVESMVAPRLRELTDEQWSESQSDSVDKMVSSPERAASLKTLVARTGKDVGIAYFIEILKTDLSNRLSTLKPPTLVIAAIADPADMPGMNLDGVKQTWRDVMGGAPNAKIEFFESTRHFVMDEKPAELDASIAAFIATPPTPAAPAGEPAQPAKTEQPKD